MVLALDSADVVLADDLDDAVALFGQHVEAEVEKAVQALRGPEGAKKPKRVTRQMAKEAAERVVTRWVDGILRWTFAETGAIDKMNGVTTSGSYTVEKAITGDPMVDMHPFTGPHTIIREDGTRIDYDAEGNVAL